MMRDIECPYCGEDLDVCHDDGAGYDEDELHQMECCHCQKQFCFTASIMYLYKAKKADCLNDGNHDFKVTNTYPRRYAKMECSMCGETKPLPKDHPYLSEPKITI